MTTIPTVELAEVLPAITPLQSGNRATIPQYGAPKTTCCLTDIATGCDAGIKLCGQQLAKPSPQTPLFQQIRNLLLDLRAEARVRRIETLNRTNNEISWLLRELYFETF